MPCSCRGSWGARSCAVSRRRLVRAPCRERESRLGAASRRRATSRRVAARPPRGYDGGGVASSVVVPQRRPLLSRKETSSSKGDCFFERRLLLRKETSSSEGDFYFERRLLLRKETSISEGDFYFGRTLLFRKGFFFGRTSSSTRGPNHTTPLLLTRHTHTRRALARRASWRASRRAAPCSRPRTRSAATTTARARCGAASARARAREEEEAAASRRRARGVRHARAERRSPSSRCRGLATPPKVPWREWRGVRRRPTRDAP